MLYATFSDGTTVQSHCGNTVLTARRRNGPAEVKCTQLQADCDELTAVLDQFNNLPHHKSARVQMWDGDFADFIYHHLQGM